MYTENIIRNLDTIEGHMQYKRPSELEETHREENEISEFGGPYKTNYESGRISTGHGLEVNPDHPHTTRQRGRSRTLTRNRRSLAKHTGRKVRFQILADCTKLF